MTLIDQLLAEQQRLQTPVARFAETSDRGAAVYSDLIPLTAPVSGEQYAFEVNLDACTGCKACVSACHSLNGLDEHETWRDTGLLVSSDANRPFAQTVTTACHHCADPGCLHGCPVLAYEKDPVTGIVSHLDDQCIGCSYCILKCPYEVPKYNPARGIVRKCDMCQGRLAHGEAPACVQACPTHAIRIVNVTAPRANDAIREFLPAAPDPGITQPTTRYISKRGLPPGLVAVDAETLRPQPAHAPLVVLLTFMPMSVGGFVILAWTEYSGRPSATLLAIAWLSGAIGLAGSVFHLGKPLRAWRIFLGWRRSWLSREALVLGPWFALATASLAAGISGRPAGPFLSAGTAALGLAGLFCSVMIYADTHREFWRLGQTAPRFFGSALILGLAAFLASNGSSVGLLAALSLATFAKLGFETLSLFAEQTPKAGSESAVETARLLKGPLRPVLNLRILAGLAGGVILPVAATFGLATAFAAWLGLALALVGELAERSLFFRAVVAPRMPGVSPL